MKYEMVADACRICLRKSRSCRSIFKPYDNECLAPSEKLKLVSGVTVIKEEKDSPALPQLICRTCEVSLNMAFSLRNRARKSDQIIQIYCNRLNKDNIIVELDTGRKFKLPKELSLRVVRKNTQPSFCSNSQASRDGMNLCDLEENFDKNHLDYDSAPNSCDETELETNEKEIHIEDEEFVDETIEVCPGDNFYSSHNEEIENHEGCSQTKSVDEDIAYIKQGDEQQQEVKPVYDAVEIAKRLDASDKYEVVSWKQENEDDSVPVFKLRLKGVETKQISKDFICEVCGNTFQRKHQLQEHVRRHNNERRYACEICNKRFTIAEGLRRHILTHGAKKPFKCDYCTRRFYNPSARKAHEIVHSGVKPYNCSICHRAFGYMCSLRKHMLIHENRKMYRCDHCNKEFRLQHHLKQHEETQVHKDTVAEHMNVQTNSAIVSSSV